VTNWQSHKVSQMSRKNGRICLPVRVLLFEEYNFGVAKWESWMRHETISALHYWSRCRTNSKGKRL